jgi:hypothetical protein
MTPGLALSLALALIVTPLVAEAQPASKGWRIGILGFAKTPTPQSRRILPTCRPGSTGPRGLAPRPGTASLGVALSRRLPDSG